MPARKKAPTRRTLLQPLREAVKPSFAVFMRSTTGHSAKFTRLHDSLESAVDMARQHAAEAASHGHLDFTFYAIEIKHRVGIEHGMLVDEPIK